MKTINSLLMLGLFSASLAAQATSMTAKSHSYNYGKPASSPASTQPMMAKPATPAAAPATTPASTSSQPMMAKPATPATPTPAAPAPASSGMGGIVGGMAAGALVGAGATMLLNSNSGEKQAAAPATTAPAPSNLVYTGNVEQDFVSAMTLWQEKHYTDVINMSAPYTKCTRCSDKEAFMIELNQLAKKNVGQ
jgi:hypothetical protein